MKATRAKLQKYITITLLVVVTACVSPTQTPVASSLHQSIDDYVGELVALNEVPGLAICVIRDGKVIYENYYGVAALDTRTKVTNKTVFRIYSLSKLMAATAIFQLVEQGKLRLDARLSEFLDNLPEHWRGVTVGHLLAHASGLPDIRDLTDELANDALSDTAFLALLYDNDRQFPTGDAWSYTQTNYLLLEIILEQVTGSRYEDYIRSTQFNGADERKIVFSSNDFERVPNRAKVYRYNVESSTYEQKLEDYGPRNNILAGLNLAMPDLVAWNRRFDDGELISAETKRAMWTPFPFRESGQPFLYGWGVYPVADQISFGFSGGGVSALRKFPDRDLTIIVLTNGYKYYSVHNTVINHVAGFVDAELENPPVALARMYQHAFLKSRSLDVDELYQRTQSLRPELDTEEVFESFAYKLLDIREPDQAILVFEKIVRTHPNSFAARENLGHALLSQGHLHDALTQFEKALEIDPENMNTLKMLQGLRQRLRQRVEPNE